MVDKKVTAKKLKEQLWETLEGLRAGKVEVDEAIAVSGLGKAIVHVANVQLKVAIHSGRAIPENVLEFSEN